MQARLWRVQEAWLKVKKTAYCTQIKVQWKNVHTYEQLKSIGAPILSYQRDMYHQTNLSIKKKNMGINGKTQ